MKGFKLSHANSSKVNLITMKRLVDGEIEEGQKPDEVPHIIEKHRIFVKKAARSPLQSLKRLTNTPCSMMGQFGNQKWIY
jgi:hypothetical protein